MFGIEYVAGAPCAFFQIETPPGPLAALRLETARAPVILSTAQPSGNSPASLSVAIGLGPPCAYSTTLAPCKFVIQTSPMLSTHSPCGALNPVSVPCNLRDPYEYT